MASLRPPSRHSTKAPKKQVDAAVVEAIVPAVTSMELQDLFEAWDGEMPEDSTSMVPFIDQRSFLLLDELVEAYLVLRMPVLGETDLKAYLSRLSITVEARVVGQHSYKAADGSAAQVVKDMTETLSTAAVDIFDDPLICATEIVPEGSSAGTEPVQHMYLFWKTTIPVGRPRTRLSKPSIFLNPVATLKPPLQSELSAEEDEYLPSCVPASLNLLGPLGGDASFAGGSPHLSASRLHKTIPKTVAATQSAQPIKTGARRLFRAAPLFLWRLRLIQWPGVAEPNTVLACFDVEITQFAGCDVVLDKLLLDLSSGFYEEISAELPHRCRPAEQFTFIYKLVLPHKTVTTLDETATQELSITLSGTALVRDDCAPKVKVSWKTAVESTLPQSSSTSGNIESTASRTGLAIADSTPKTAADAGTSHATISPGVGLTITAPRDVWVNETFFWEVIIVNRSTSLQRLAIIPVHNRRRPEASESGARPVSGSRWNDSKQSVLEQPILEDNVLHTLHKHSAHETTDLICLTPDVRIGSLGPSACYVAHLKFLPLVKGLQHLQALRVIDLTTQQTIDIVHLPSITASERASV